MGLLLLVDELAILRFLEQHGDSVGFAFIAAVAVGWQDLRVLANHDGVMFTVRPD